MTKDDFKIMVADITKQLNGKTISHATCDKWGMGYSVTLHFTDGTDVEIVPEHDEGFIFALD